jgi:hypothetical protein
MPHRRKLEELERSLTEWRRLLSVQKKRIAELQRGGHSAAGSIILLREMENSVRSLAQERAEVKRRVARHDGISAANEALKSR